MAGRLRQLQAAAVDAGPAGGIPPWQAPVALAAALAAWDGKAHLGVLRDHTAALRRQLASDAGGPNAWVVDDWLVGRIVELLDQRIDLGDGQAVAEYLEWIKAVPREKVSRNWAGLFGPMGKRPADPAVAAAAEALFNGSGSAWNPVLRPDGGGFFDADLIRSPLLGLAAFRAQVARMLADRSPAGQVALGDDGDQRIRLDGGGESFTGYTPADPGAPPAGSTVGFRVCDLWGRHLAGAEGMPRVELYWSADRRDAGIARQLAVLARYGDRYRYDADEAASGRSHGSGAGMTLPPLAAPATAADVAAGRAVFTLAGEGGEVRLAPLPRRPWRAVWTTLMDHPREVRTFSPDGKYTTSTTYDQDGWVWQAEEVLRDGRWRRYYGFVGPHDVARVAAEEVEFDGGRGTPARLAGGLGVAVEPPGARVDADGAVARTRPAVGEPVEAVVWLRNRRGVEQAVPARYAGPGPDGKLSLANGIKLRLFASAGAAGRPTFADPYADELRVDWEERPAATRPPFAGDAGTRTLATDEEFEAFRFDVRDWFGPLPPGDYQVQVTFDAKAGGPATGESHRMAFSVGRGK